MSPHGIATQNNNTDTVTTVRTSYLISDDKFEKEVILLYSDKYSTLEHIHEILWLCKQHVFGDSFHMTWHATFQ